MIIVESLTAGYGKRDVLTGINMKITSGEVHGIAGLNGSGKSTLLDTLYGFIRPRSGTISYKGTPVSRSSIAYLESSNYFYPDITGNDYLRLFRTEGRNLDHAAWEALLNIDLNGIVSEYSTGMKKKLALLGVLSLDRDIILMDEPFNGLDLESVQLLHIIIETLKNSGKTIIITSHILETLTRLCDNISLLREGEIADVIGRDRMDLAGEIILREYTDRTRKEVEQQLSGVTR